MVTELGKEAKEIMDKVKTFLATRKSLEYGWNFITVISTVIGILAMMAASYLDGEDAKGFGFAAIWSMFLVIFMVAIGMYTIGGSASGCFFKEREYSTPLLTGFFLGRLPSSSCIIIRHTRIGVHQPPANKQQTVASSNQ